MRNPNLSRVLILGEIDGISSNDLISQIYEINEYDNYRNIKKREPIRLIINSEGGCVYYGLGILDVISLSTTPIHTICHGHAMSMGFIIFCAGKQRFISQNSTFMYHEISLGEYSDKLKYFKDEVIETERIQKICDDYILSKTIVPLKKLRNIKKLKTEWYITPEEALEYKIVNKIL